MTIMMYLDPNKVLFSKMHLIPNMMLTRLSATTCLLSFDNMVTINVVISYGVKTFNMNYLHNC